MLFFNWPKNREKASVGKFVGKSLSASWKPAIEVPSSPQLAPRECDMSPRVASSKFSAEMKSQKT